MRNDLIERIGSCLNGKESGSRKRQREQSQNSTSALAKDATYSQPRRLWHPHHALPDTTTRDIAVVYAVSCHCLAHRNLCSTPERDYRGSERNSQSNDDARNDNGRRNL